MPDISNGTYAKRTDVVATVWPSPDKDGDGPEVEDDEGNFVKDAAGNEIHHYEPPEGFHNIPTSTHQDSWVRVDERRRPKRNVRGEAVTIVEGSVLLEYPDGSSELLTSDAEVRRFLALHEQTGGVKTPDKKPAASKPGSGS